MPNWCNNTIEIRGLKEELDNFELFLKEKDGKDWFTFFRPLPDNLKDDGWYEWSINHWGCKWNCDAQDWSRVDENLITFWFDSPWGPPIALYEFMTEEGFNVYASYHEEGMCFVGEFTDGFDSAFEYSDLESLDTIPDNLIEQWNLREMLEDREFWDEENENE